jgi:hypothetical protein
MLVHAECGFEQRSPHAAAVTRIHELGNHRNAGKLANSIGRAQCAVTKRGAFFLEPRGLGAQHQVRKIYIPLVWRHIRTFSHVAHVAQVAIIDDLPIDFPRHAIEFHGVGIINGVEQSREGMTEIEATTAAVADVEDASEFIE